MGDRPSTSNDCSVTFVKAESPLKSMAYSSSEMKDDRPSSPHDCAICLEQLKDKSFTNSCLHMFCFPCLLAWSKVKPECPLCKQDFCSIIHNIRSMTDYDEYHVPPPVDTRLEMYFPDMYPRSHIEPSTSFLGNQRRFFSYRSTLMANNFSFARDSSSNLVIQPYVDNLEFQSDFPQVHPTPNCLLKRMDVYLRSLETLPPPANGRYRESSPEFYRENEGQLHRLARWLNRELEALSRIGVRFVRYEVQQLIVDLLPVYYINSDILYNIVRPYLGVYTRNFLKEFYYFAVSPYEMDQYDRECTFTQRRNRRSHLSFIVTVGRDDTEDVQVIPDRSSNSDAVRQWIDVSDFTSGPRFRMTTRIPPRSNGTALRTNSNTSNEPSVIHIDDSDNDCIIIDQPSAPTIVVDDSTDETEAPARALYEHSSGPLDLSASRIEEPSLPSHPATSCNENANVESNSSIRPSRPLPSRAPSILSTEISSDENRNVKCKRKKSKKRSKSRSSSLQPKRKRRSVGEYALYLSNSSSEEMCEDDDDDEDWLYGKTKRKRKTRRSGAKKEKKPKERKREKKKRKSAPSDLSSTDASEDEKHSKKSKRKKDRSVCGSGVRAETEMDETSRTTTDVYPTTAPKLKSVVKKVEGPDRSRGASNLFDRFKDLPSTSRGYVGYYREISSPNFSNHLSDSD